MPQGLILINSLKMGGGERVIINLMNEIDDSDIDILLLENVVEYEIDFKFGYFNKYKRSNVFAFFDLFILALRLNAYCNRNNISLVQSHLPRANYVNIIAGLFNSRRNIQIVSHGIPSLYKSKGFLGKVNIFLMKILYNRANTHIVVSKGLKNDFENICSGNNGFEIIYNPFPIKNIVNDSLIQISDFFFDESIFYFIFCGRLNAVKKVDQMVIWFSEYCVARPDIALIILGDGVEKDKIGNLIGNSKNIYLLGNKSNPYVYMANANCLLLNSDFEGFGNVIVESLICSTPVISSDCDYGPREILCLEKEEFNDQGLKYNDYSILFKQNDKQSFFNSLDFMMSRYASFKTASAAWRYHESRRFTSENIVSEYKKILNLKS